MSIDRVVGSIGVYGNSGFYDGQIAVGKASASFFRGLAKYVIAKIYACTGSRYNAGRTKILCLAVSRVDIQFVVYLDLDSVTSKVFGNLRLL